MTAPATGGAFTSLILATPDELISLIKGSVAAPPTVSDGSRPCVTHAAGPVITTRHSGKADDDLIDHKTELNGFLHRGSINDAAQ